MSKQRLIDADKLIKSIGLTGYSTDYVTEYSLNEFKKMVDAQPTAYDVDKVVERLDDLIPFQTNCGAFIGKEDTVRIVKAGGMNEH